MTEIAPELLAWIAENHCSYDIAPIVELQEGNRTEVGFELNLHAQLPWKGESTPALRAKADEIREKLTELVHALVPKDSEKARFEIVPYQAAVRFARGGGLPEMTRTVRIFHRDFRNVEAEDRAKFGPFEERLRSLGFKRA
jgi:hypothetical protein